MLGQQITKTIVINVGSKERDNVETSRSFDNNVSFKVDDWNNCHEYGIFFVPSVCLRYCGSRMEDHSCVRTKVLAEDVSSDGTVQKFKLTVSRG